LAFHAILGRDLSHVVQAVGANVKQFKPGDLPPVGLMDMGFVVNGLFARHLRPPIRFLFIGSHLCSALLSGPASRRV